MGDWATVLGWTPRVLCWLLLARPLIVGMVSYP
jgi:hypothetical protein